MADIEKRFKSLNLFIRLVFTGLLIITSMRVYYVFSLRDSFQYFYKDALGDAPIPLLTVIAIDYSTHLVWGVVIATLASIIGMFTLKKHSSPVAISAVVLVLAMLIADLAVAAYSMPMIEIITHLEAE